LPSLGNYTRHDDKANDKNAASDGYATGPARLWDEQGRLCAIATQTAHLRRR